MLINLKRSLIITIGINIHRTIFFLYQWLIIYLTNLFISNNKLRIVNQKLFPLTPHKVKENPS